MFVLFLVVRSHQQGSEISVVKSLWYHRRTIPRTSVTADGAQDATAIRSLLRTCFLPLASFQSIVDHECSGVETTLEAIVFPCAFRFRIIFQQQPLYVRDELVVQRLFLATRWHC